MRAVQRQLQYLSVLIYRAPRVDGHQDQDPGPGMESGMERSANT